MNLLLTTVRSPELAETEDTWTAVELGRGRFGTTSGRIGTIDPLGAATLSVVNQILKEAFVDSMNQILNGPLLYRRLP